MNAVVVSVQEVRQLRLSARNFIHLCEVLGIDHPEKLPAFMKPDTLIPLVERAQRHIQQGGGREFTKNGGEISEAQLLIPPITLDYVKLRLSNLLDIAKSAKEKKTSVDITS